MGLDACSEPIRFPFIGDGPEFAEARRAELGARRTKSKSGGAWGISWTACHVALLSARVTRVFPPISRS